MDSIHIYGGKPLLGQVSVQGSKNAALPILAASLLVDGVTKLENCPKITDIFYMIKLLESIGAKVTWEHSTVIIDATKVKDSRLPEEYVVLMRSSVMLMGSLLARLSYASMSYPGGCVIGKRPVDIHLSAMEQMGCFIERKEDGFVASCEQLIGARIVLPFPSVGVTENVVLAAALAKGVTVIENAACEPEVAALCEFIVQAGGKIEGIGTKTITILGSQKLHSCHFKIPSDRIVAGTYAMAAMATGGMIHMKKAPVSHMEAVISVILQLGGIVDIQDEDFIVIAPKKCKSIPYLETQVYPGFPTDLQSPLLAVLSLANGTSTIKETIFEDRFRIVSELQGMGADIRMENQLAIITGVLRLDGKHVVAEELRGGAALVIAALSAKGFTTISNKHFIDRGYENIERDLIELGGNISLQQNN